MKMTVFALVTLGLAGRLAAAYEPPVPAEEIDSVRYEWHDAKRAREVPAKFYFPKAGTAPLPVVIFSHGLGGSREGYEYLGRHWAACGYVSVHLQHLGSDEAVWKNAAPGEGMKAMSKASLDLRNALNRPPDVSFAIDQLTVLNTDPASPVRGRLDLDRIAVAGHSFGGFTAMVIAGQALGPTASTRLADPRVKCAIEMSAPVAPQAQRDRAYGTIKIPVLHLTGTLDDAIVHETKAEDRRIPFDLMTQADTALIIFQGGDHMVFSGRPRQVGGNPEQDAKFQRLTCAATTAFLDGYLKPDAAAQSWIMDGGFGKHAGAAATVETKRVKR